ncbi:MAG: DUF445 family protein [Sumerlaeia bacterium]
MNFELNTSTSKILSAGVFLYSITAWCAVASVGCLLVQIAASNSFLEVPHWFRGLTIVLFSGAVGFGTNWLAIKMLFHPRQHTPWLPFWPQGMLPREQKRFAEALGQVTAERLLNQEALLAALEDDTFRTTLGLTLRQQIEQLTQHPETRALLAKSLYELWQDLSQEAFERFKPELRRGLDETAQRIITAERLQHGLSVGVKRFAESRPLRKSIAKFLIQETARDGSMERIMELLKTQFDRYREKNPVRGFLAEQFMLDWSQLRNSIYQTLRSDEATDELAALLISGSATLLEKIEQNDSLNSLHKIRGSLIENMMGWLENDGFPLLQQRVETLSDSPALWAFFDRLIDDLLNHLPGLLINEETNQLRPEVAEAIRTVQNDVIRAFPIAEIVEKQVNSMDPRELQELVETISRNELATIQVLGFVLGVLAGGVILWI